MSYSVNWVTKVISIPTADLTLVSGTRYSLDMTDFLAEIRRLEWEPTEGLWAPAILDHTDTRYDFAGANYAPFDDMINDYTIEFTGIATRVDLLGSNNDIIDVLIATGVSVVPSNSAGLQIVTSGSGITEQDMDDIVQKNWDRILSAATHNIPLSAGRRLRQIGDIIDGSVNDASASTTAFITNLTESRNDFYNDQLVRFTSGNLEGYVRVISYYDGATGTITVSEPMIEVPDNGIDFDIIPTHIHPIEEIGSAPWEELAADHITADTMGEQAEDTLKKAKLAAYKL